MTTSLNRSFRLSSTLKIEEEAVVITKNQGISSILDPGFDCERSIKSSSSLRRTLSADMSSTKWLTTQMKKIASSEEFSVSSITDSSSSYGEDEEEDKYDEVRKEQSDDSETEPQSQLDIWGSIQKEVYEKKELEKPGQFDIWSSIISQKEQENNNKSSPPPPPYIHPLVRRSASSLSEKSLEICTESLGSETGSDGFSSYAPSETGDGEDDKEMQQEQQIQQQLQERVTAEPSFDIEQLQIPKYSYVICRRSPQRSFPPPIPSLSRQDGGSIRMQSHRNNGRLVLEAVSVPSANNFRALRQDGRLVLTFVNSYATEPVSKNEEVDELEEEEERESEAEEEEIEEEEEERGEKEVEFEMEQGPKLTSGVMNVHRLTLMGFANRDARWAKNFNEVVKFNEGGGHINSNTIVAQSLPSSPRMARLIPKSPATTAATAATGASFNAYEYYWRPKPTMVGAQNKGKNNTNIDENNTNMLVMSKKSIENHREQQQLLVLRGNKGDYLFPSLKSCKEPRRSLLFWEPYCAALV